jgi:hypothetical protein
MELFIEAIGTATLVFDCGKERGREALAILAREARAGAAS